jgi:malonate decarboxylase alpha subunit
MGSDARGRRHSSAAWLDMITGKSDTARGRKLVVQVVETFHKGGEQSIVDTLDAVAVGRKARMPLAPVMIYGDDVTHLVTEEGVAYLYKSEGLDERKAAIAAIAGATQIGLRSDRNRTADLRSRGIVATPEDLKVRRTDASRTLLAARSIDDLVAWSGGLYQPPAKFRSW